MNESPAQIESTIAALEAQRALLGDAVVDSALAPLRRELARRSAAAAAPGPQLKQVSVLFVDVVGSTAMGQQLQPEDIHAVMDSALERFTAVVQQHRGRVLQYTGDGMLAAFGADTSHEDDAESAIRAALGVIEAARLHAPQVRREHGVPDFNVRAGINTGTVLLGAGIDAEGSIRGAVVNIAARMEQSAPPGGLRISHDTCRLVRGLFEVDEQTPIAVKGVDAPVRSYLVRRPRRRSLRVPERGIEGVETGIVGRDRELAQLEATFDAVAAEGRLRAVTVLGDAGLGKSRLLSEFQQGLQRRGAACWLLSGRTHPRSALQPYDLLRDLIARQFMIADSDSAGEARDKLVAGLEPVFGAADEASAHLLGHLIGLDFSASPHVAPILHDAHQIRERAFDAVVQLVRRLSASNQAPVVVMLDDLHWADDGSLDCVEHVLRSAADMPLMLLSFSRPVLLERRAGWVADEARHARIDLEPLDTGDSAQLASALLRRIADVPAALRTLVIGGAEGNPFYMEELVKMLIDDGVIDADAQGWRVLADRLLTVRVPPTLTGVLQVRLDALSSSEKTALQQAAVIGQVFSDDALAAIDRVAPDALPALLRKQLIVRRDTPPAEGAKEYAFHHNLLHQVAYDGVLKPARRDGHAKVGWFWSARAAVASPQDVDPVSCRALAEAHYHRCQADAADYVGWFESQFSNYLKAYAAQTLRPLTEDLVGVCERHFGADHVETAKALTNLARVLLQGGRENVEPLLRRAIAIQERQLGADHPDTARTVAVLAGCFSRRGDPGAAEPLLRRALAAREAALGAEDALTVSTLDQLSGVLVDLRRLDEAEAVSRRVLDIRERLHGADHPDTWLALTALADVLSLQKRFDAAEPLVRRALGAQRVRLTAQHPDIGLSLWNLAEALHGLGRHAEAETLAREGVGIWERSLGADHEWTAWGLGSLAKLRLAQDDPAAAVEHATRALEIHERVLGADHRTVGEGLQVLGHAQLRAGDRRGAAPTLERALSILGRELAPDDPLLRSTRDLLEACRAERVRS